MKKLATKIGKTLNRRGMSMVSVILAFFILVLLAFSFTQSVRIANNVTFRAREMREQADVSFGNYYQGNGFSSEEIDENVNSFNLVNDGNPSDGFVIGGTVFRRTDGSMEIYEFGEPQ